MGDGSFSHDVVLLFYHTRGCAPQSVIALKIAPIPHQNLNKVTRDCGFDEWLFILRAKTTPICRQVCRSVSGRQKIFASQSGSSRRIAITSL
jgi:hypothetical protein